MKKTVILDGKKIINKQYETVNLVLCNNNLIGIGYIPDDENCIQINAKNHLLVPNIINLGHIKKDTNNNGISLKNANVLKLTTPQMTHFKKNIDFIFYENLLYEENITQLEDIYNLTKLPFITHVNQSEFKYILNKKADSKVKCHLILTYLDDDLLKDIEKISTKQLSIGLNIDSIEKKYHNKIIELILKEKISSLSSKNNDTFLEQCYNMSQDQFPQVMYHLYTIQLEKIFKKKHYQYSLLSKPNLSVIYIPKNNETNFNILTTISDGTILK